MAILFSSMPEKAEGEDDADNDEQKSADSEVRQLNDKRKLVEEATAPMNHKLEDVKEDIKEDFGKRVAASDELTAKKLEDTKEEIKKDIDKRVAPYDDILVYRIVVGALGLTAILAVFALWIPLRDGAANEAIVAIGSAAVGGLAGMLAPRPTKPS